MIKRVNNSVSDSNRFKISLIILLFIIALNLNISVMDVSYADSTSYSQSNVLADVNLTVTVNSQNLLWDEILEININIINRTSMELIPNSQILLNITSIMDVTYVIPMKYIYILAYEPIVASTGSINRSFLIQHIPTLNPYLLSVHYINNSEPSLNVSFYIYIESIRTGFISFFTFEHFIILYFGLLLFCGIYLGYSKYRNKTNEP